jgi:hypothetical protein
MKASIFEIMESRKNRKNNNVVISSPAHPVSATASLPPTGKSWLPSKNKSYIKKFEPNTFPIESALARSKLLLHSPPVPCTGTY